MATQSGPYGFLGDQLSTLEKARLLRSVPLLSDVSEDYLMAIARHARDIRANNGDTLVREGDQGNELMLLLDGNVSVQRNGQSVNTMGPGEYFGELSLLDGEPRSADVVAVSPARVLTIDHPAFEQVLASEPSLAQKIILNLCRMIRSKGPVEG